MRARRRPPWTVLGGALPAFGLGLALLQQTFVGLQHGTEPALTVLVAAAALVMAGSLLTLLGHNLGRLLTLFAAALLLPLAPPLLLSFLLLSPSARAYTRRWEDARHRMPLR